MSRAAAVVDVCAVRLAAQQIYLCAKPCKQLFRSCGSRAVCAVNCYPHSLKALFACGKNMADIACHRFPVNSEPAHIAAVSERLGELFGSIEHQCFYFFLDIVGELEACARKKLYPVKFHAVVRSGYHHSPIGTHSFYKKCHCGSGNNSQTYNVRSH